MWSYLNLYHPTALRPVTSLTATNSNRRMFSLMIVFHQLCVFHKICIVFHWSYITCIYKIRYMQYINMWWSRGISVTHIGKCLLTINIDIIIIAALTCCRNALVSCSLENPNSVITNDTGTDRQYLHNDNK